MNIVGLFIQSCRRLAVGSGKLSVGNPKQGRGIRLISGRVSSTLGPRPDEGSMTDRTSAPTEELRRRRDVTQRSPIGRRRRRESEAGFTLVELLIVTTVLPLIIGALSVGLISVFSLQSGVASRLSNTSDSQVVAANYQSDVQGTSFITTDSTPTTRCTSTSVNGTQLLGLWSNVNSSTQVLVSYVSVPVVSGTTTTYALERLYCSGDGAQWSSTPTISTLSNNLPQGQAAPTITCVASISSSVCSNALASQGWLSSQNISQVSMTIAQPSTASDGKTGADTYTLVSSPAASSSTGNSGSPVNTQATTNCYKAAAGSGPLANNLCFVDFTPLNNPAYLAVAETPGTCLEMSASLGPAYNYDKLFFCISITEPNGSNPTTGATPTDPEAWPVPTYSGAFFGNLVIGRRPVLRLLHRHPRQSGDLRTRQEQRLRRPDHYHVQRHHGGDRFERAGDELGDRECRRGVDRRRGEALTWTADTPLSVVPNDIPVLDGTNEQYLAGNACLSDQSISGLVGGVGTATPDTISCNSDHGKRVRDRQSEDGGSHGNGHHAHHYDRRISYRVAPTAPRSAGHRLRDVLAMIPTATSTNSAVSRY